MKTLESGVLGTVKLKITVVLLLAVLGGIIFWLFLTYPYVREPLTYAVGLVSALTVVFSAYHVASNSALTIARDKIHRTFEFTKQLNDVNFVRMKTFLESELDHQKMTPAEFYTKVAETPEISSAVKLVLGIFEDASIAVQHDYVDEPSLYASLSFLVPWCARNFHPYITEQRKIANDGSLYAELDKLADAWKKKTSLRTNQPL